MDEPRGRDTPASLPDDEHGPDRGVDLLPEAGDDHAAPTRLRRRDLTPRERRRRRRASSAPSGDQQEGRERRSSGLRARRASQVRRRRHAWLLVAIGTLLVALGGLLALVSGALDGVIELVGPETTVDPEVSAVVDRQPSLLLVTHDEADPSGHASGIQVLAYDRETGEGTILLVPTATVADLPGYGSFQLREAFALGRTPLVDVSVANLLGVRFSGHADVSHTGWAAMLDRVGGYDLEVRSRLVASEATGGAVRFEPGSQFLDGARLAEYLTFRAETETELAALPRAQDVLLGLLDAIAERPALLDEVVAEGLPGLGGDDPDLARTLLGELAEARADGRVTTLTLPVAALGSGREDSYRLDTDRAESLVLDRLAASRPTDGAGAGRGVQILNGNGVPAVGQQVAQRLGDGRYRIILTGNADSFDYPTTLIVVYDDSDEQLAVARDVRERLGVGEIQRSGIAQSVVDVTIVVGADFPG